MRPYRSKNLDMACLITAGVIIGTVLGWHAHPYPVVLLVFIEAVGGLLGFLGLQIADAIRTERRKRDIRPVLETEKTWEVSEFWVCNHPCRDGSSLRYVLELEKGDMPRTDQVSEIICGPFPDQADATSVVLKTNLQEERDRKARKGTQ